MSNSPETIATGMYPSLYQCEIPLTSGTRPARFWLWHKNTTGGNIQLNVLLSLASGTGTAQNIKYNAMASSTLRGLGQCLAKMQLAETFDYTSSNVSLGTSESSILVTGNIPDGYTAGVCIECDVVVSASATLRVRTAWSSPSGYGAWSGDLNYEDEGHIHVRGWWPSSKMEMACPTFDATPIALPGRRVWTSVCASNGPEHDVGKFGHQASGDPNGTANGNRGCYGVDLVYKFPITNPASYPYPVWITALARNTGNYAYGAVETSPNGARGGQIGLNPLYHAPTTTLYDWSPISVTADDGPAMIEVPVNGTTGAFTSLSAQVVTGGGCATPFSLCLSGITFTDAAEPEN